MNIFYLDANPVLAARYHADRHVIKMILESAQLLSTTHHISLSNKHILSHIYKPTHYNHPSTIWVRQSKANYQWLYTLFLALIDEYKYRFGKTHKSSELIPYLKEPPLSLGEGVFTPPTPAMDDEYLVNGDSLLSYRKYYRLAKSHLFSWTKRERPEWLDN
ncbi:MAG: pyrimidine dimer DNA glycosylase/endonuclease V [Bacilli bacterium]|nr:pyrimidine dimer DNA glycosylase/endonuclease V [Bacilli bacterium]